jgi:hypothetical protein
MSTVDGKAAPAPTGTASQNNDGDGVHGNRTPLDTTSANVTQLRLRLRRAGFDPVPVRWKGILPERWQERVAVGEAEIRSWPDPGFFPLYTNTGILTRHTPAVDVDIMDPRAAGAVEDLIRQRFAARGSILIRIGLWPKRLIPFRTDAPFPKIKVIFDIKPEEYPDDNRVEILGDGQQFVGFGTHPGTRRPYEWRGGIPGEVRRDQLPLVTAGEMQQLLDDITVLVADFGFETKMSVSRARDYGVRTLARSTAVILFPFNTELLRFADQQIGLGVDPTHAATERKMRAVAIEVFKVIPPPNPDLPWDFWKNTLLWLFAGSHGSSEGRVAAHIFSAQSNKYNTQRTDKEWRSIARCPPRIYTSATLFEHCDDVTNLGWRLWV